MAYISDSHAVHRRGREKAKTKETAIHAQRLPRLSFNRSLVISYKLLGTGLGASEGKYIDSLTISNQEQSVLEDVTRIRAHPLVPARFPVYGYIYDATSGRLIEVPAATKAGRAV